MTQALGLALVAGGALLVYAGVVDGSPADIIRTAFGAASSDPATPGKARSYAFGTSQASTIGSALTGSRPPRR